MRVFWREHRIGQKLILQADDGSEAEVGAVRRTSRGFDAMAKAIGYDPGRATKGLGSLDEAKRFVESFTPWDLYEGTESLAVEPDVEPAKQEGAKQA
jgi:hypothetical protein